MVPGSSSTSSAVRPVGRAAGDRRSGPNGPGYARSDVRRPRRRIGRPRPGRPPVPRRGGRASPPAGPRSRARGSRAAGRRAGRRTRPGSGRRGRPNLEAGRNAAALIPSSRGELGRGAVELDRRPAEREWLVRRGASPASAPQDPFECAWSAVSTEQHVGARRPHLLEPGPLVDADRVAVVGEDPEIDQSLPASASPSAAGEPRDEACPGRDRGPSRRSRSTTGRSRPRTSRAGRPRRARRRRG